MLLAGHPFFIFLYQAKTEICSFQDGGQIRKKTPITRSETNTYNICHLPDPLTFPLASIFNSVSTFMYCEKRSCPAIWKEGSRVQGPSFHTDKLERRRTSKEHYPAKKHIKLLSARVLQNFLLWLDVLEWRSFHGFRLVSLKITLDRRASGHNFHCFFYIKRRNVSWILPMP